MVWSTNDNLEQTVTRVQRSGPRVTLLTTWHDIDCPSDFEQLERELIGDSTLTAPATRQVLVTVWPAIIHCEDGR